MDELNEWLNKILEVNQKNGISTDNYVIEECSELIKELIKYRRGKSSIEDIIGETCDVLCTSLILLKNLGVGEEEIKFRIVNKCKKACRRYYNHGEV